MAEFIRELGTQSENIVSSVSVQERQFKISKSSKK